MKPELAQMLTGIGVSAAAIAILVEEELDSESSIRLAVKNGIKPDGMKAGSWAAIVENFCSASASIPTAPTQQITVKLDRGPRPVSEMDDPDDLLAVLASDREISDKKAAARQLSSDFGRKVVVEKDKITLRVEDTKAFWKKGTRSMRFWGRDSYPVIDAETLFKGPDEKVEVDPFELASNRNLVALENGYNSESGADWSDVTMERRALLVDAVINSETVASGDSVEIAEALAAKDLKGKWKLLESRADAERIEELKGCLKVPLSAIDTPIATAKQNVRFDI